MNKSVFRPWSDAQLRELLDRRNPHHPLRISAESLEAFLRDQLIPESLLYIDLSQQIELLIRTGYANKTNFGSGMSPEEYRALWPKSVYIPCEFQEKFNAVLLVDRTITWRKLAQMGGFSRTIQETSYKNITPEPRQENGTIIQRYIAFIQRGKRFSNLSMSSVCANYGSDEVGLVAEEGLQLALQFRPYLRLYGVYLTGTWGGSTGERMSVQQFLRSQPDLVAVDWTDVIAHCGTASRSTTVIPVPQTDPQDLSLT